jgi:hypothetical protein
MALDKLEARFEGLQLLATEASKLGDERDPILPARVS